jgi:DNA-binding NarL/FixJ family response regulator
MDLRVLIIADDALARAGLAALLNTEPGLIVAGQAAAADDIEAAVAAHRPDVLLWDLGHDPEGAASRLAGRGDDHPVVALLPEAGFGRSAWAAGARGLLLRDAAPGQIGAALAAAALGMTALSPEVAADLVGAVEPPAPSPGAPIEPLTPRELEVLRLLAEGLPNKVIARRLAISEHTVKFHVNAILGKLGVDSRTEAVVRATRLGLIFL